MATSRVGSAEPGALPPPTADSPSTTSVTSIVRKLEADGHITRRPHPDDGRAVLAEITDEGRALVEKATRELVDADFGLGVLDEPDLRKLSELLRPVRRAAGDF